MNSSGFYYRVTSNFEAPPRFVTLLSFSVMETVWSSRMRMRLDDNSKLKGDISLVSQRAFRTGQTAPRKHKNEEHLPT
jgi:hypothetical protein